MRCRFQSVFSRCLVVASVTVVAACDSGAAAGVAQTTPISRVADAPAVSAVKLSFTTTAKSTLHLLNVPVYALGTAQGEVIVGSESGVSMADLTALEAMQAVDGSTTGGVLAMTAHGLGQLVAAKDGIFHVTKGQLVRSGLGDAVSQLQIRAIAAAETVDGTALWIAADEGLHRVAGGQITRLDLGEKTAPVAVGVTNQVVFAAYDSAMYEIDPGGASAVVAPAQLGAVSTVVGVGEQAWFASATALAHRSSTGSYTVWKLLDEQNKPLPVLALAPQLDRAGNMSGEAIFGLTARGVFRCDGETIKPLSSQPNGLVANKLVVDGWGHVWVAGGPHVVALLVGAVPSFAADVAPVLTKACNNCHLAGAIAPKRDFGKYALVQAISDTVVERIALGSMPPGSPLDKAEQQVVYDWYTSGMLP